LKFRTGINEGDLETVQMSSNPNTEQMKTIPDYQIFPDVLRWSLGTTGWEGAHLTHRTAGNLKWPTFMNMAINI